MTRRNILRIAPLAVPFAQTASAGATQSAAISDVFPTQPPALAKEMVTVSHGNFKRVRELVEARPSLAKATWDWGFGDWETALGAASHTGNRDIAEYLIANGAHPTLFSATMLGELEVVKAFVAAQPGAQRIPGPHSISLLAHAVSGKAAAEPVLRYLESLGDAGSPAPAPFSEAEAAALTGIYVFGSVPSERIELTAKGAQLTFTRIGTTGRGLVPVGEKAFYPQGAEAVRIRFTASEKGIVLTVHDPDPVLTAIRITG